MINAKFNCHNTRPQLSPAQLSACALAHKTTENMAETSSNPSPQSPAPIAEISLGPSKLDQFLDNHQTKLVIAAILIAIGVVAYVVYDGLAQAEADEAGAALLVAQKPADYQELIKKWPGSNAAASAQLLLAQAQWPDSQPDSIASLETFISKYPQHPSIGTAKTSLGLRLLDQGKTQEATEILTEVAENNTYAYMAPMACIALGDIAKDAGQKDEATQWYEKAQQGSDGQGNAFQGLASARLLLVNAEPPAKVKPALPAAGAIQQRTPLNLQSPDTAGSAVPQKPAPQQPASPAPSAPETSPEGAAPAQNQ